MKNITNLLNTNKGFKQFTVRLVIFLLAYSFISILYPYLKALLNQDTITVEESFTSFLLYFVIIILLFTNKDKIIKSPAYKNKFFQTIAFLVIGIIFLLIPSSEIAQNLHLNETVSYFLLYALGQFFVFLSIFNTKYPFEYLQTETLITLLIVIAYSATPFLVEKIWPIIFEPIRILVNIVVSAFTNQAVIHSALDTTPITIIVQISSFKGAIGSACSGVYSFTAFTFLFITSIVLLKGNRTINWKKTTVYYILGILALFILNILRISAIILIGAFISLDIAMNLFHEYLSSIFLLILLMIYIYKVTPKLFK